MCVCVCGISSGIGDNGNPTTRERDVIVGAYLGQQRGAVTTHRLIHPLRVLTQLHIGEGRGSAWTAAMSQMARSTA